MPMVLDASVTASWVLPDEDDPDAAAALERVRTETGLVPALWWYEIRNILLMSERRRRLSAHDTADFLTALSNLPIETDQAASNSEVFRLARVHGLTIYDATYLELAKRTGSPLATLDADLERAARSEGILRIEGKLQAPPKKPPRARRS